MKDETGVPGKPYRGKNGKPRKTRPHTEIRKETPKVVTELFPEDRQAQPGIVANQPPGQKRKRIKIGRGWSAALDKIDTEGMTMQDFVKELSPEELARGQLKNAAGSFVGAPPKWVPTEFHRECIRELMRRGKTMYQENYLQAIQAMTDVATTPTVDVAQRLRAAQFVIERIEGKVPEKLEVGVSEPWQELLTGIVATVDPNQTMRKFAETQEEDGASED